jgi:D-inositol-3-phosphate glycosyltransferase
MCSPRAPSDEAAELRSHYWARCKCHIMIVPPGVDLHTFHPCDQPKSRAQFGVAQDIQVILFVGGSSRLRHLTSLIKALLSWCDAIQDVVIGCS